MSQQPLEAGLNSETLLEWEREYGLYPWRTQKGLKPLVVDHAKGNRFYDTSGKQYLDSSSMFVSSRVGRADELIASAIGRQASKLETAASPFASEPKARLPKLIAEITPKEFYMKRSLALLLAIAAAALLLAAGCSQAAPPPAPAPAPSKGTASQPTAATQPPTAIPANNKTGFPVKGRAISLVVPYAAGGPSDIMARLLGPIVEKDLGTPVEVVDKPGAGSEVAVTYVAQAKPDGYTIGTLNIPAVLTIYMDPERHAAFGKKDLQPLAVLARAPGAVIVKADSPFKTLKDLIDAAKAKPGKVTLGAEGYMGTSHLAAIQVEKAAGVSFAIVQFDGAAPAVTALLGGHVTAAIGNVDSPFVGAVKNGSARALGVMDTQENKFLPGVPTFESQGYPIKSYNAFSWVLPGGTPKEMADVLSASFKKAAQSEDFIKKMEEASMSVYYMDPAQMSSFWDDVETQVKPLMDAAKQQK